jgi:hypothetical protein
MMLAHPGEQESPARQVAGELLVVLPSRQDMADITALTLETVSRMVSQLRYAGILAPQSNAGHPFAAHLCGVAGCRRRPLSCRDHRWSITLRMTLIQRARPSH